MDHFQNPRDVGEIENASGVGTVGNAKCGDIMRMFLDIDDILNPRAVELLYTFSKSNFLILKPNALENIINKKII